MTTHGGRHAWTVALVTFTVLLAAAGVRTAPGILLQPWAAEFGWTRAGISLAVAISFVAFGLGGPFVGSLIDRLGPRRVMLGGLGLVTAGLLPLLVMRSLWHLHLLWGVLVGMGTGMLGSVLGATVAYQWFDRNRGLVLGLLGTASSFGSLLFYPAITWVTLQAGWRTALGALALGCVALLGAVAVLVRNRPAPVAAADDALPPSDSGATQANIPLGAALRTADFWLLAGSFFVCGYTSDGIVGTHFIGHTVEHGFSPVVAAGTMSLISVANVAGTVLSGWLTDRLDNRKLLATFYGLRAFSLVYLPFLGGMGGLLLFALIMGLDWSATVPPTVNLIAGRFGKASLGKVYGWVFCAHMIGAGLASYAGGLVRDLVGTYTIAFLSAALLGFMALAMVVRLSARGSAPHHVLDSHPAGHGERAGQNRELLSAGGPGE
ncbi:MAG TPA: MFS transporter [Symbiobacteriaceae bacterium]|nr:MFS transporter [Symbiobacteriaceae bacterium]